MKVLVVDDSKAMRMIVIRALRQSGVDVDQIREAEDGADGLAAVAEFAPDLVLSDWDMPNMTGIELLTALRASGNSTTFGFVTSESSPAAREHALARGASFLLVKPFDGERFAEVIGATVS
jgi:two-component system chemotaxis response regulator CheY